MVGQPVNGLRDLMRPPLVSVVIPTHNRAAVLRDALDSVYAQEGLGRDFELEVIVVDDASTDSTPNLISQYSATKYIRLPTNRGASAARNAGIKASGGTYVALLDDDDVWLPHRLRVQLPVMEETPSIGVVYGQNLLQGDMFDQTWPDASRAPSGSVFRAFLLEDFIAVGSLLIRRSAFDQAGYFDENLMTQEHYEMCLRLAFHVPFRFLPGPVYIQRFSRHGKWFSNVQAGGFERSLPQVIEKALAVLPDTPQSAGLRAEARAALVCRVVDSMSLTGDFARMRDPFLAAIECSPDLIGQPFLRRAVRTVTRHLPLAPEPPSTAARRLASDILAAGRRHGRARSAELRSLLSVLWMEAANICGTEPNRSDFAAAQAAAHAVAYDPRHLAHAITWRYLVRGLFPGPRWDNVFALRRLTRR